MSWQLTHLVYVIVTDSAANCLGIFNAPGHLLQRVVENEIFSMASVKKLIEDVRSVHYFANISTNFCEELTKLQKEKNPEATPLLLSPDVRTRWNSTHAMFKRSCRDCICIEMAFVFVMWRLHLYCDGDCICNFLCDRFV